VVVELRDGRSVTAETGDWLGFYSRPMPVDEVRRKFDSLTASHLDERLRDALADVALDMDNARVADLTALIAHAGG
jgi:hypothetical protein